MSASVYRYLGGVSDVQGHAPFPNWTFAGLECDNPTRILTVGDIGLTVDSKGRPENLAIIDTTDPKWADRALRQIEKWRFEPARVNGQAAAVEGVFELTARNARNPR